MNQDTFYFFKWLFNELPPEHSIVIAVKKSYIKEGKNCDYWQHTNNATPEAAATCATTYATQGFDVFYAIGMYANNIEEGFKGRPKVSRKKKYSQFLQELILDIDAGEGKPYPSHVEAIEATIASLTKLGLSTEEYTCVKSGGGVHVHILLEKPVPAQQWEMMATKFKQAILSTGLDIDISKTLDVALVLRPVGTFNYKKAPARPVEFLQFGEDKLTFERFEQLFDKFDAQAELMSSYHVPASELLGDIPVYLQNEHSHINIGDNSFKTTAPEYTKLKCPQLLALEQDANVPQPLWYSGIGVAAYTAAPQVAAIAWSKQYEHYNQTEVLQKLHQAQVNTTGPTLCRTFEHLQPDLCRNCTFKGVIKTPLQSIKDIGERIIKEEGAEYTLPPEYRITKDNKIIKIIDNMEIPISDYRIFITNIARHDDTRDPKTYIRFAVYLPSGLTHLELTAASLVMAGKGGDSFQAKFMQLGVAMTMPRFRILGDYLIDAYRHHQANNRPTHMLPSFGWLGDYTGFVWSDKIIKPNSNFERVIASNNTMRKLGNEYQSKGTLDGWKEAMEYFNIEGIEHLAFGVLLGFGTPLYSLTKLQGVCVNFYSENTGSGKSTSCWAAQSIYGNPLGLTMDKDSSNAGIFARLGTIRNLPALMDEVSDSEGQRISALLYSIATGKERDRSDINGDLRDTRTWSLVFMTTSNKALHEKLDEVNSSSAGQKARLIEVLSDSNKIIDEHGKTINTLIGENYGQAALPYLSMLVTAYSTGELQELLSKAPQRFEEKFGFKFNPNERFIAGAVMVAWVGGLLAKRCGLIDWDLDRIISKAVDIVKLNRVKIQEAVPVIENIIGEFLTESYRFAIHNFHYSDLKRELRSVVPDQFKFRMDSRMTRGEYDSAAQDYRFVPVSCMVTIPVKVFKDYCRQNKLPFGRMEGALTGLNNYRKEIVNLTANLGAKETIGGLPITGVSIECYRFNLSAEQLDNMRGKQEGSSMFVSTAVKADSDMQVPF